mgnify:CR=1 FL=1
MLAFCVGTCATHALTMDPYTFVPQHTCRNTCTTLSVHVLLPACLQSELGLIDRVAFASKYSVNSCLQAVSGEHLTVVLPCLMQVPLNVMGCVPL